MTQNPGETVQQFVTRLRKSAKDCEFGTDTDNQIRDAVLNKCISTYIKRKFLEEGQGLNRGTQRQFFENIRSEDDLRSRIFGTFVVKFLAYLPLLGFSNS